jgi:hypothetical protein
MNDIEEKQMTENDDRKLLDALKQSFPPANTELGTDLWPQVLRRLEDHPALVPWYDWALAGLSAATLLAFPRLILVLAYHL